MAVAPYTPEPVQRPTRYSLVATGGRDRGIEVGDRFTVDYEGAEYDVKVIEVKENESLLRITDTGLKSYGRRSIRSHVSGQ